jgi:hypothetical protein
MAGMILTDSDSGLPYGVFWFGVFPIFLGGVYASTGQAWVRFQGWVYRAKDPKKFWWEIAWYCLGGVCCIGYYLYKAVTLN